jgi:hypothetical protein
LAHLWLWRPSTLLPYVTELLSAEPTLLGLLSLCFFRLGAPSALTSFLLQQLKADPPNPLDTCYDRLIAHLTSLAARPGPAAQLAQTALSSLRPAADQPLSSPVRSSSQLPPLPDLPDLLRQIESTPRQASSLLAVALARYPTAPKQQQSFFLDWIIENPRYFLDPHVVALFHLLLHSVPSQELGRLQATAALLYRRSSPYVRQQLRLMHLQAHNSALVSPLSPLHAGLSPRLMKLANKSYERERLRSKVEWLLFFAPGPTVSSLLWHSYEKDAEFIKNTTSILTEFMEVCSFPYHNTTLLVHNLSFSLPRPPSRSHLVNMGHLCALFVPTVPLASLQKAWHHLEPSQLLAVTQPLNKDLLADNETDLAPMLLRHLEAWLGPRSEVLPVSEREPTLALVRLILPSFARPLHPPASPWPQALLHWLRPELPRGKLVPGAGALASLKFALWQFLCCAKHEACQARVDFSTALEKVESSDALELTALLLVACQLPTELFVSSLSDLVLLLTFRHAPALLPTASPSLLATADAIVQILQLYQQPSILAALPGHVGAVDLSELSRQLARNSVALLNRLRSGKSLVDLRSLLFHLLPLAKQDELFAILAAEICGQIEEEFPQPRDTHGEGETVKQQLAGLPANLAQRIMSVF